MLAQPGREEEEEEWWGGELQEAQGNSACLLVPASMAKWGWEPGGPVSPSRPSLSASRNHQARLCRNVSPPFKMPLPPSFFSFWPSGHHSLGYPEPTLPRLT